MQQFYPTYYHHFHCIADRCPDSCCQGWYILPDDDALRDYARVPGDFGRRLREHIGVDEDGDTVFLLIEDDRCPFWAADKLCDIYRSLGEAHLCRVCAVFPRLCQDYTTFCEHDLALACPEAARLILCTDCVRDHPAVPIDPLCADYTPARMAQLLTAREELAAILSDRRLSLSERLARAIEHDRPQILQESAPLLNEDLARLYSRMEYCVTERGEMIRAALAAPFAPDERHEAAFTRLFLYQLYRYYLTAIQGVATTAVLKYIACTYLVLSAVMSRYGTDIVRAAQAYSKDIEQSDINMDLLFRLMEEWPQLTDRSVIRRLREG